MTPHSERIFIITAGLLFGLVSATSAAQHQKKSSDSAPSPPNGHFESAGRTGFIPTGRIGWREINHWRTTRRSKTDR